MQTTTSLAAIILLAALLVWWSMRAVWHRCGVLKWLGLCFSLLVTATASVITALAVVGLVKSNARIAPVPMLHVAGTADQLQRGQAITDSFCSGRHSATGQLTGGRDIGRELPLPIGSFISANLTPAGQLKHWSDGEIFRAIRNAIDADDHWLTLMSYTNAGRLSDADIMAVIAYLRSLPADGLESAAPADRFNLLGLVMLGAGLLPTGKPVIAGTIDAPPKGPTQEWGAYILSYQDCRECHGVNLTGGVAGQIAPLGPDLNLVKRWSAAEFISTLRSGVDPDGHPLGEQMPWRPIGRIDDDDPRAIYEYLKHMPEDQDGLVN